MILYIRVRKSYFQISDFYTDCSVIYVIYNHNIIKRYVLSYHMFYQDYIWCEYHAFINEKNILCIFDDTFRIHCKMAYR